MATRQELEQALAAADAAGDTQGSQQIAGALQQFLNTQQQQVSIQQEQLKQQQVIAGDFDREAATPFDVRVAVGAAKTGEDKLLTLQQFFPDARPFQDNFIFTNPRTNRQQLLNPEGFDIGDIGENFRIGFETLGGVIGGAAGIPGGPAGPVVMGAVGAGVGGKVFDFLAGSILPVQDHRTALETVGADAAEFGINLLGGVAGDAVGEIVGKLGTKISQATRRPIAETFEAGERIGVDLPASAVTGAKGAAQIESALAQIPIASDIIGTKFSKTLDAMSDFAKQQSERLSSATGETTVGQSVINGVDNFVKRFSKQGGELYDRMWAKMPKGERVSVDNFKSQLDNIVTEFSGDPKFSEILTPKTLKTLQDAIKKGPLTTQEALTGVIKPVKITVGTLKALRSKIGGELDTKSLLPDASQAELKRLYGALSEDMKLAADSFGATKEFNRANGFWNAGRTRIDEVLQPIVKSGMAEQVYRRMFGAEGQALRKVPTTEVRALMRSLPEGARRDVQAEVVRRMGLATPGAQDIAGAAFSPNTFMTNWNRLGEKSRSALFHGDRELISAMDDLALVSQSIKAGAKTANTSNTAGSNLMIGFLTGGLGVSGGAPGLAAAAGVVLAPAAAAKLMTNKSFVKWLAKSSGDVATEKAIGQNLGRLITIAEVNPEIRNQIHQYLKTFEGLQSNQQQEQQ